MGAFCCHGNHSFDRIWPKTLCCCSPTLQMLYMKFGQDRPGLRDILVQKCGRKRGNRVLLYYQLTTQNMSGSHGSPVTTSQEENIEMFIIDIVRVTSPCKWNVVLVSSSSIAIIGIMVPENSQVISHSFIGNWQQYCSPS